jgi:hypothetical protein
MNTFEDTATQIAELIIQWEPKLRSLPDDIICNRRNGQNRTIRQIVGHLADSASNNTHRVIHLQYQHSPLIYPNYASNGNNDRWIAIQDYQNEDRDLLISLWKYSMLHYCHIIKNIDKSKLANEWIASPEKKISLLSMIEDFPRHLKLHLYEINELINLK